MAAFKASSARLRSRVSAALAAFAPVCFAFELSGLLLFGLRTSINLTDSSEDKSLDLPLLCVSSAAELDCCESRDACDLRCELADMVLRDEDALTGAGVSESGIGTPVVRRDAVAVSECDARGIPDALP